MAPAKPSQRQRTMAPEDGSCAPAAVELSQVEGAADSGADNAATVAASEDTPPSAGPELVGLCCPGEMLPGPPEAAAPEVFEVQLPPCHGVPGPTLGELPATEEQGAPPPPTAAAPPAEPPPRGKCLIYNWQEERATNDLDHVPGPEYGTEGFFFRHGHPGLLTLQFPAYLARSTTMKDSYRRPWRTGLPERGQREAKLEWLLYQKHSKELMEQQVFPPPGPMESLSTMHHDYRQEGFVSVPPPPTKPHNYQLEQPQTFWQEHAWQVPGVSAIRMENTPFKKCTEFTTPLIDQLRQPLL